MEYMVGPVAHYFFGKSYRTHVNQNTTKFLNQIPSLHRFELSDEILEQACIFLQEEQG